MLGRGAQRGGAVSVHHVDVGPGLDPALAQIQVTVQSCAVQEGVQTPGHRPVGDVCPLQIVACGNNFSCNTLCLNVCLVKMYLNEAKGLKLSLKDLPGHICSALPHPLADVLMSVLSSNVKRRRGVSITVQLCSSFNQLFHHQKIALS